MAETSDDRSLWLVTTALILADTAVKVPSGGVVAFFWVFSVNVTVPAADNPDSVALLVAVAVTPAPAPAVLMAPAITLAPAFAT